MRIGDVDLELFEETLAIQNHIVSNLELPMRWETGEQTDEG